MIKEWDCATTTTVGQPCISKSTTTVLPSSTSTIAKSTTTEKPYPTTVKWCEKDIPPITVACTPEQATSTTIIRTPITGGPILPPPIESTITKSTDGKTDGNTSPSTVLNSSTTNTITTTTTKIPATYGNSETSLPATGSEVSILLAIGAAVFAIGKIMTRIAKRNV